MSPRAIVLALALVLAAGATSAFGQPHPTAQAFVEGLYRAYQGHEHDGGGPDYLGRQRDRVFAPKLIALMRRDAANTPAGEVGALDGDPICNCQDYEISKVVVRIKDSGGGRASAEVHFDNSGRAEFVQLDLVSIRGGWRVADVHTQDTPSLVRLLEASAEPRRRPTAAPR
jgi:hypothetical protein